MTKINKLGKSTFVIAILSFLLVAVLAFGGTYAYFSAKTADVTGGFKTGHLNITLTDGTAVSNLTVDSTIAQPNQYLVGTAETPAQIKTTIDSNIDYFVRVYFTASVTPADEDAHHIVYSAGDEEGAGAVADSTCGDYVDDPLKILTINITGWTQEGTSGYYYPTFTEGGIASTVTEQNFSLTIKVNEWVGANGCKYYMDATASVTVRVEVLQADYLDATIDNNASLHQAWDGLVAKDNSSN